jgi:DNA repair exonuclease SbcCD ATPase subunit
VTQEPDTQHEQDQEHPDPFALLVQAAASARGSIDNAVHQLAVRFAETSAAQEERDGEHREALRQLSLVALDINEAFQNAAAETTRELGRLKQQGATHQETTGKRIVQSTQALTQRFDAADTKLEEISDSQGEHYRLTGAVLEKVSPLPENLFDYAENTRDQIGQLSQAVADHQALTAAVREDVSALPEAISGQGEETREQVGAALALVRTALDAIRETGADVRGVENALAMVIGAARDQILAPLNQYAAHAADRGNEHTGRLERIQHVVEAAVAEQATHSTVLEAIAGESHATAQAVPQALSQTLDALAAAGEETRRTVLDVEQRISAALALNAERADQALTSIAANLGHFSATFDAFAEQAASAAAVDTLRGDVSALSELLASSTEDFTGAVQQAVADMTTMRTAWSQESAAVLQALDKMGRMFLEKANASEYARDQGVIELGRRVARLELDRAPAAVGS